MQIAVIGAGNMGCLYGSNFARVGEQVTMVDIWEEHVKQMQAKGLEMDGLHGKFIAPVQATTDPASVPKADIAFICVNGYSTRDAADAARILLKDSGYAVTLQNGLGNVEILTEVLGKERVMAGLTFHSAELLEPGKVLHTNHGPTYLGELDRSRSPRLMVLNELMSRACMEPVLVEDIIATMWSKFVHNCGINAVCAITGLRPGHIREVPEVDEFQTQIIQEALALVKAKGITLPEKDPLGTIKEYCAKKFHKVSMVQHLERGRLTEIDSLNGYIVRESEKLGLSAPYNDALTKLIKGLQYIPADGTKTR
ncbi:MAG TPA: 2-dehydropantoate 2-reductase [Candidatus Limnocylindrales bacterium]|nr:2-dehydropantoate 2-reductase [Candidatus Limnocylindrales bacterium]